MKKFHKTASNLPPYLSTLAYSLGREKFFEALKEENPEPYEPPLNLIQKLWGIEFRAPLFNSAGMFKTPELYDFAANLGAGAFIMGTLTWNEIEGNKKLGIPKPFLPLPKSNASVNSLGLPNPGRISIEMLEDLDKVPGVPVGVSVAENPHDSPEERIPNLIKLMELCERKGADFLELNPTCPNVSYHSLLKEILKNVSLYFLNERERNIPVLVKISGDTETKDIPYLANTILETGFDGITGTNTSTRYKFLRQSIHPAERKAYDFFTEHFGGGVSGAPIKYTSKEIIESLERYISQGPPSHEFHLIKSGGIKEPHDLEETLKRVPLAEWYTGCIENYLNKKDLVYERMYKSLKNDI